MDHIDPLVTFIIKRFFIPVTTFAVLVGTLGLVSSVFVNNTTYPSYTSASNVGCGVKKDSTSGKFTFSPLHVGLKGYIRDAANCQVHLVGFNQGSLSFGNADGDTNLAATNTVSNDFSMNVVRVTFNASWWDINAYVPAAHMFYQKWLQSYVSWEERNGNYVLLDKGSNFTKPPCGSDVTTVPPVNIQICPTQDQGQVDYLLNPNATTALGLDSNIDPSIRAWMDISKLYANDPAVLFDLWNEPTIQAELLLTDQQYFKDMNILIDTVRQFAPKTLVVVYSDRYEKILSGQYPDFYQPNLIIDYHIFNGFHGVSAATGQSCTEPGNPNWIESQSMFGAYSFDQLVQFVHANNHATIISEWGGCNNTEPYNTNIIKAAIKNNVGLIYSDSSNVYSGSKGSQTINANGVLVQKDYKQIMLGITE